MNMKRKTHGNKHAVVIGASMAGLVAARVLSDHFEQVTIIERDQLTEQVEVRKGVPQGQHVHNLLAKGSDVLTELFPGLFEALTQDGALRLTPTDMRLYRFGMWNTCIPDSIHVYSQSRPFLEHYVRNFLAARSNVRLLASCDVTRLLATPDSSRIIGVSLRHRSEEQREEELVANLVVDACGRGSRTPRWLVSLGYTQVEETSIKVDVGYATRIYRRPDHLPLDWKLLIIFSTPPQGKRAGWISSIEGDRWMVTLGSPGNDFLPFDDDSFLDYARSLPQPNIYEAIKGAEPLTPVLTYKYSANRRRHYERMPRFPEAFVVLGDALCCFNPMYAQGMTVAALEARTLDTCLQQIFRSTGKLDNGFSRHFQKAIAKVVDWPWQMATGADLLYSETQEKQTWSTRLLNWYMLRLMQLSFSNLLIADAFYQVQHMLKSPITLFNPRIVWTALELTAQHAST